MLDEHIFPHIQRCHVADEELLSAERAVAADEEWVLAGLEAADVVVLSLTVEWGVGMERQDPSYGAVVNTRMYEFRPFSEEVTTLRLGARRRSTGLCV